MGRKTWFLIVGLLVAMPAADALLWHIAVGRLEDGFAAWVARCKDAGWTVTHGRVSAGGWPWAAAMRIRDVTVSGGDALVSGGAKWQTPDLRLRVSLLRLRSLDIEVLGDQRIRAGTLPEAVLTGARLMAVSKLTLESETQEFEVLAERPRLDSVGGWALSAEQLRMHIQIPALIRAGDAPTGFSLGAESVVLPPSVRWPLGGTIGQLAFDGTLEGPIPAFQAPMAWAAAWRDGGGSLQVQNLTVNWGPLSLTAAATLALDDQLQPMGAGTSKVAGYAATLDALAVGGALSRSATTAAKAVLSLLAGTPGDGDAADVEVPLTLQYRTLSMRQVPLLRLPEVEWTGQ